MTPGGGGGGMLAAAGTRVTPEEEPDMGRPPADLAGLTNCFNVTACDPATMLCIKYLSGTPGNPGAPRSAPSCYQPMDPCANGVLDCACIQADPSLAMNCGRCFDNGDATFTCYAQ